MLPKALAVGLGLALVVAGCGGRSPGRGPAMSGGPPALSQSPPTATTSAPPESPPTTTTTTTTSAPAESPPTTTTTTTSVPPELPPTATTSVPPESPPPTTTSAPPEPADPAPAPTTTTAAVVVPRPVTPDDDGDVVYLTFDDGPSPDYTPQMLDVLARHGARATFFVVGSLVQSYPELVQRIAAEGHTVANHTWNHEDLAGLSRAAFDETIGRTQAVLGDLAAPCLRPPYGSVGASTREWAAAHGLTLMTWDASPRDWLRPSPEEVADYLVQWARPGVVILMHDGGGDRSRTVQGLDMALERLTDRGLRYEPVCR